MPQQLLHDFELCTHASQQRRIRVTKRVPADTFLDSNPLGDWTNMLAQDRLSPVWLPSPIAPAGENPVVRLRGDTLFPPLQKGVGKERMNGYWLLRRFGLTRADDAVNDRSRFVHCALGKIDVALLQAEQLALPQACRYR